jgi:hypothetical protein
LGALFPVLGLVQLSFKPFCFHEFKYYVLIHISCNVSQFAKKGMKNKHMQKVSGVCMCVSVSVCGERESSIDRKRQRSMK